MNFHLSVSTTLCAALAISSALGLQACAPASEPASDSMDGELRAPGSTTPASDDPFDPSSCAGPLLTEMSGKFAPGASRASLGRYTLRYHDRTCTELTGCGPWSTPVDAKEVLQTGLYALITWGDGSENGYVKAEGRAELAVFKGQIVLELTDDGAKRRESGVRHFFAGGAIARSYPYGTTGYNGDYVYGPASVLATAGGTRDGSWMPEHQTFLLRGELRRSCARLVASPGPAPRSPAYREVEVAALLRY